MAKKNSLEQAVYFTVPCVRELEGTWISSSTDGIVFRYRKPGGSAQITEFFPFNDKFYGVVGKEGAANCRLFTIGHKEIFGNKKRNSCVATDIGGHVPGFVKGDGGKEIGKFIINANFSEFRAEEAGEGGRGRKKAEAAPAEKKSSKKASEKKAAKPVEKKTAKKSKKPADDEWED